MGEFSSAKEQVIFLASGKKYPPAKSIVDLPLANTQATMGGYAEVENDPGSLWIVVPVSDDEPHRCAWRMVAKSSVLVPWSSDGEQRAVAPPTVVSPQTETDPNGLDAHTKGAKLDFGKTQLGLVLGGFARSLEEVGKVGTYGARKYTPNGWMEVENGIDRYTDAMLRHYLKERTGESCDPDTGLLHAAHLAWNALARLDLMIREAENCE